MSRQKTPENDKSMLIITNHISIRPSRFKETELSAIPDSDPFKHFISLQNNIAIRPLPLPSFSI